MIYSPLISEWLCQYGPNYLSHATNNCDALFLGGRLCSAEELLQQSGTCECEVDINGSRCKVEKKVGIEATNYLLCYEKTSKKTSQMFTVTIAPKYALTNKPASAKDRGLFWTYKEGVKLVPSQGPENEEKAFLAALVGQVFAAVDQQSQVELIESDPSLASSVSKEDAQATIRSIWKFTQKKGLFGESALLDLWDRTFGLRNHYIRSVICTAKNRVLWNYGSVALIIGRCPDKLCSPFPLARSRLLPFDEERSDGCEFYLKAPFQVDTGYYSESLESKENLVIGPKQFLDRYRQDPRVSDAIKSRFVDIETMYQSEKGLFSLVL